MIIGILIFIIIISLMPIKIVVTKDEIHNDIDIYLTKLFNKRIDFDEFIKFLLTTKENRSQVTIKSIKHNYEVLKLARHIIYDISKMSNPEELHFTLKIKKIIPEIDCISYVFFYNLLLYLKGLVKYYVPKQEVEIYKLEFGDKFNFTFKWSLKVKIFFVILSLIKNFKDIILIFKYLRKGKKAYGTTSNLRSS
mgnify:CR=1 FL=1